MSDSVSFDPACEVLETPSTVTVMVEAYCLGSGTTVKEFEIKGSGDKLLVDAVWGTLSFYGLNWPWWKRVLRWFGLLGGHSTAICGTIGSITDPLVIFDIQGKGNDPQTVEVYGEFSPIELDKVQFNLYPDLALPTDFRAALIFHRVP